MSTVREILAKKGSEVHTIDSQSSAKEAVRQMVEANIGSVIVTRDGAICGIFTERDYLRRIILDDRPADTQLAEVVTEQLVVVDPERTIDECMAIMTQERIRHLPVMRQAQLVGIVSIGDLVKHLSKEQATELRYLTDLISGRYST
jgi:signal-transduction protein with cAMP-binding, CBS, and nucleotidyltransferase domain